MDNFKKLVTIATIPIALLFSLQTVAHPKSVQVCVDVINDNDVNGAEGGFFTLSIIDQQKQLTPDEVLEIKVTEVSERNEQCTVFYSFFDTSNALSTLEMTPVTFEWMGNADGYPVWEITDLNGQRRYKQGSGYTAELTEKEFARIPYGTNIRVTYINKPLWHENSDGDVSRASSLSDDLENKPLDKLLTSYGEYF